MLQGIPDALCAGRETRGHQRLPVKVLVIEKAVAGNRLLLRTKEVIQKLLGARGRVGFIYKDGRMLCMHGTSGRLKYIFFFCCASTPAPQGIKRG